MAFANINHLDLMSLSSISIATVFNVILRTGKPLIMILFLFLSDSENVLCKSDWFFWSICHKSHGKSSFFPNRIPALSENRHAVENEFDHSP